MGLNDSWLNTTEINGKMFLKKQGNRILLFSVTLFLLMTSFNMQLFAANTDLLFHAGSLETNWQSTTFVLTSSDYLDRGCRAKTIKIQGNVVTCQEVLYRNPETSRWDSECSGEIFEKETWVYKATVGDSFISFDNESVQRIKLETIDYYSQLFSQEEINDSASYFNRVCGFVPSPGEIMHESECDDPETRKVGLTSYGLFQVDSDTLYMNCNRDSDTYPITLNKSSFWIDKWVFLGETTTSVTYYHDSDGDGYGDPNTAYESTQPLPDYVTDNTDCNDSDSSIHPGATEISGDGIDQNCDDSDQNIQDLVTEIYVATFERAPDYAGLMYWTNAVETGLLTIEQVAQSFFDHPETKAKFPEGSSNTEFITTIYQNTLSRLPDSAGLAYWAGALDRGEVRRDQAIMAIINGAKAVTSGPADAVMLAKKTEIGLCFANSVLGSLNTNEKFMDWARDIIFFATSSDFSVEKAEEYIAELIFNN